MVGLVSRSHNASVKGLNSADASVRAWYIHLRSNSISEIEGKLRHQKRFPEVVK
jgi:hypothetical protein